MLRISIKHKLISVFILISLIACIVGIFGIKGIQRVHEAGDMIYRRIAIPDALLISISTDFQSIEVALRDMMAARNDAEARDLANRIIELGNDIKDNADTFEKTIVTPEGRKLFVEFNDLYNLYDKQLAKMVGLMKEKRNSEATALLHGTMAKLSLSTQDAIKRIVDRKLDLAKKLDEESDVTVQRSIVTMIVIIVAGVLMAVMMGVLISLAITRPIREIVKRATFIAGGNLSFDHLVIRRRDEIGDLSEALNAMSDNLHDAVWRIFNASSLVTEAAAELDKTFDELARGSKDQLLQSVQVAALMGHINATMQQIAIKFGQASANASAAGEAAKKRHGVISRSAPVMESIAQATNESKRVIEGLSDNTRKLDAIVGAIDDVGAHANMLAVSAGIEAAHIGENCKGFAVFADKVKKLAEQTSVAIKESKGIFKSIQDDIAKAASSIDASVNEVEAGARFASLSGDSLADILDTSQAMQETMRQIADAIQQQSAALGEMTASSESIASVGRLSSLAAQRVSSASRDLNRLTNDLQFVVHRFTLKEP